MPRGTANGGRGRGVGLPKSKPAPKKYLTDAEIDTMLFYTKAGNSSKNPKVVTQTTVKRTPVKKTTKLKIPPLPPSDSESSQDDNDYNDAEDLSLYSLTTCSYNEVFTY